MLLKTMEGKSCLLQLRRRQDSLGRNPAVTQRALLKPRSVKPLHNSGSADLFRAVEAAYRWQLERSGEMHMCRGAEAARLSAEEAKIAQET